MLYGGKYEALDEAELEKPLEQFRSINELFTRGVKPELRPFPERTDQFLSPVDGTVQDAGRMDHDSVMTIKGIRYTLNSLCPETDTAPFHDGHFAILFLSPRDCHRVFTPAEGFLQQLVHVPGHRLLVHPPYQTPEFPVFSLNERLVMQLDTPLGKCLLILVAGWGVGHITHPFRIGRRFSPRRVSVTKLEPPRRMDRAEWIATFELGSTVILITEQSCNATALIERDQKVQFGQPVFDTKFLPTTESP
jgi:phosphatidylserine decarboxylase